MRLEVVAAADLLGGRAGGWAQLVKGELGGEDRVQLGWPGLAPIGLPDHDE